MPTAIVFILKKKVEKDYLYYSLGNSVAKVPAVSGNWPQMNTSNTTSNTI